MATNFSPCKGSYVLNQFPSNVMFGMNGFHVSASGAIQGHLGPLVSLPYTGDLSMCFNVYMCALVRKGEREREGDFYWFFFSSNLPAFHCVFTSYSQEDFMCFHQRVFNPFPNKPWFLRVCSTSPLKTLWEKEKLLVTSNFSFWNSVFNPY